MGVLRDPHLVADAFQKTVIKAIEAASTANPDTIRGWLFQIALNIARDLKRELARRQRKQTDIDDLSATGATDRLYDGIATLITAEEKELVRQALSRLSPNYRDIVIRRVQHGQTFAEIAEDLDRPLGTILTWMRRALNELREMNVIRRLSDDTHLESKQ